MDNCITNIEIDMRILSIILKFTSNVTESDIIRCVNYNDMKYKSETIQAALEIFDTQGKKAFNDFYK